MTNELEIIRRALGEWARCADDNDERAEIGKALAAVELLEAREAKLQEDCAKFIKWANCGGVPTGKNCTVGGPASKTNQPTERDPTKPPFDCPHCGKPAEGIMCTMAGGLAHFWCGMCHKLLNVQLISLPQQAQNRIVRPS